MAQEIYDIRELMELILQGRTRENTAGGGRPISLLCRDDGTLRVWSSLVGRSADGETQVGVETTGEQRSVKVLWDGSALIRALADSLGRERLRVSPDLAVQSRALAQAEPAATTLTDLYTVPASTETDNISIHVCNRNNTAIRYRVSLAPLGAADATSQYLAWDVRVPGRRFDVLELPHGFRLDPTDVVRVQSNSANTVFTLNGLERT